MQKFRSIRKLTSIVLAFLIAFSCVVVGISAAANVKIAFTNSNDWSQVYIYSWDASDNPLSGDWPGTQLTDSELNDFGKRNFYTEVSSNATGIIFNNGGNEQTVDIAFNGQPKGWYLPGEKTNGNWNVTEWAYNPDGSQTEATTVKTDAQTTSKSATSGSGRVQFTNNQNWNTVYAYAWDANENSTLGDWPGTAMTKIGDNGMGSDNYEITVPANTAYIIFTDGRNQTVDIPCQTGTGYYPTTQTNGNWNVGTWDLGDQPVDTTVAETTTQPVELSDTPVYFRPNANWASGNVKYAMYSHVYHAAGSGWTELTPQADGTFIGYPVKYAYYVYFARFDANTTEYSFDNALNQTTGSHPSGGMVYTLYDDSWTEGEWLAYSAEETTTKKTTGSSRVVFTNNQNWNTVYAYAWDANENSTLGDWPGTAMTKIGDNGMGSDNYEITVLANTAYIIFTDGRNQTVDIPCQTGTGYYPTTQTDGKWNVGTWDLGDQPVVETTTKKTEPVVETTTQKTTGSSRVVFTNNQNWNTVYAYGWTSSEQSTLGDWPGTAMTKIGDNGMGSDNYEITVPANTAYIIFTDGSSQTVDIPCQTGTGYYPTNQTDGKWNVGTWDLGDQPVVETTTKKTEPVVETTTQKTTGSSRVVFTNNQNWNTVYAYAWDANENSTLGDWPGTAMTKIGDNGMGSDNYEITVPANTAYIIFTDGRNQTVDIPCQTGTGYYPTTQTDGKWNVGTWDLGDQPVDPTVVETTTKKTEPVSTNKVVFTNNQHWNTVYAYGWTSSEQSTLGDWPGTPMTKIGDNGMGSDNYEIIVPANTAFIIFTDGSSQTVDIPCQTGKGYYPTTQTDGKWNVGTWDLEVQQGTEEPTTQQGQIELTDPEIPEQTTSPVVGSEVYDPSRTVRTYSISLADAIGMTFRVLKTTVADLDNPYVVVEMNGEKTVIDTYTEDPSRGEYLFKFNKIYPQNLADEVTATVYGMKNGTLYYGPEYTKSVKGYVENQLSKSAVANNVPMRKLLVSLLNYGAETQRYINYNTDNLATSGLTNEQKNWGETNYGTLVNVKNYNYETYPGTTSTWKSASLVLGSTVVIKTRFTAGDVANKKIRVEINGAYEDFGPETIIDEGNGTYAFSYAGVYANAMNETVKFTVMENGKPVSSAMTYSIASYASNYVNSTQYPTLASLLRAMMCYGKAAESFG